MIALFSLNNLLFILAFWLINQTILILKYTAKMIINKRKGLEESYAKDP